MLPKELDNKGYICPNCKATFSTLEADRLMDFTRGTFVCDQCATSPGGPHEVVMNEDAESVRGSKDRMERFNKQTRFIREGLKRSENMVLPAYVRVTSGLTLPLIFSPLAVLTLPSGSRTSVVLDLERM